jgi:uncharacterized protein (DUF58 family)
MTGVILIIGVIAVIAIILSLLSAIGAGPAALIISLIAIAISIVAYHRTGGTAELMRKIESNASSEDLKKRENGRCPRTVGESHPENRKRGIGSRRSIKVKCQSFLNCVEFRTHHEPHRVHGPFGKLGLMGHYGF